MKTIEGYDIKIFTDNVEYNAMDQLRQLLAIDVFSKSRIRVMPDVHAGAGCVIGFTGDIGDKVIPNIVGVDIGCGVLVQPFEIKKGIDYHSLNELIINNIPSGRDVRDSVELQLDNKYMKIYSEAKEIVKQMKCFRDLKDTKRLNKSIGSLGGGNHFIEIDKEEAGKHYLMIHTGSRDLGRQVASIYQKLAVKNQSGWAELMEVQKKMIEEYKAAERRPELQDAIAKLHCTFKMRRPAVPEDLCWLEGEYKEDYLHDMKLCQRWAELNRRLISEILLDGLNELGYISEVEPQWESVHNYIDDNNLIRKGAISAEEGQLCVIPLNMRDGSLICEGLGNPDWNNSAPHGAGRIMSRAQAFHSLTMDDFRRSMTGIYSESINEAVIDEAPMVYKPKDEIIANIAGTVRIINLIKPVFNFKASN